MLDDRDLAAKSPHRLRQFDSDISCAITSRCSGTTSSSSASMCVMAGFGKARDCGGRLGMRTGADNYILTVQHSAPSIQSTTSMVLER